MNKIKMIIMLVLMGFSIGAAKAQTNWGGSGTEASPYTISNAAGLVELATNVNAGTTYEGSYFKLTADIDLSSVCGSSKGNWTPIGYEPVDIYDSEDNFFSGVFDGNGKTISNLYIDNNVWHAYAALFGYVSEGTIKNLTVAGSVTATYAAGIVARLDSGNISDCYNMAEIEGGCAGGIFAMAGEGSVVENCQNSGNIVVRSAVHVSDRIRGVAGGIGGMLEDAEVRNCCNTGAVQGQSNWSNPTSHFLSGPNSCAGGIVAASYDGKIDLCCNMGPVSEADYNGGICGYYDLYDVTDPSISQCYNLGTVEGNDIISVAAGIVGACGAPDSDIVTDCYNAGIVKGTGAAGGIVGFGNTNISNCYNIGHVSAEEVTLTDEPLTIDCAGAIAGGMLGTMVNCYYDRQMCPLENDYYSVDDHFNITAHPAEDNNLLTAAMTNGTWNLDESVFTASEGLYPQLTVFAGQTASLASVTPAFLSEDPEENVDGVATDFTVGIDNGVVWSQADGADVLAFNGAHVSVTGRGAEIVAVTKGDASKLILMKTNKGSWCWEGEGTEDDPFEIADAEGLVCLAGNVNAGIPFEGVHFVVTADIDLSTVCGEGVGNWSSIGKVANNFEGIFDGGNHTISNLYINDEYETCAALFGSVSGATIKNLTVAGEINAKKAAGVCVKAKSSNFDHCTNQVDVVAEDAAGVCVKAESTNFDHCTNHADVVAEDAAGVCYELRGTESSHCLVTNCSNEGDIAVSSGYAGGIIGKAEYVNVSGCSNSGSVEGLYAAGICAYFCDGTEYDEIEEFSFITDCHNSGDITASSILYVDYDSYTRERSYAGGIVAYLHGAALYGCYNTGSVHATFTYVEEMDIIEDNYRDNAAGGICAYSVASNVYCSYNTGNVGGAVYNGGIVGYYYEGTPIYYCYNMGIIEGHDALGVAGGIAGCCVSDIYYCYNAGIVKTSGAAGGIAAWGIEVVNCYNVGYVSANICEVPGEYYGLAFAGAIGGDVDPIINCYYDKQMCPLEYDYYGHVAVGNDLLTEDMVGNELQAVLGTEYWVYNDAYPLYPQLKAFAESANEQDVTASLVSATPAFLVNEEDVEGVSTNFTVGTNDGVAWSYESGDNVLRFSGSHVSLLGNGNEMVAVSKDGVNKYIPMTILYVPDNLTWVDVVISEPEGFSTSNIDSPEDLAWFISYVNGFNGCSAHPSANGEITADIDMSEYYWVPIGFFCQNINSSYTMPYTGYFNGNFHNVDGIRVSWNVLDNSPVINALSGGKNGNRDARDFLGMFGLVEEGRINDLNLASATITSDAENNHTIILGGIAGSIEGGTISRCVSNATVTQYRNNPKGGIVGEAEESVIDHCTSTATLIGYGRMGGIVGEIYGGSLTSCYADAKFLVSESGTKEDSYASYVGGLAGVAGECQIANCYVRLREDSEYGLTKESDEEHYFGLLLAVDFENEISYCYGPEGTGYKLVGVCVSDSYQFERATSYEEIRTNTKGETFDIALAVRQFEGSYFLASTMTDHVVSVVTGESTMIDDKEVLNIDESDWEIESHLYATYPSDDFQFYMNPGSLRCDATGMLYSGYHEGASSHWHIFEQSAGKGFGGFRITNWDNGYSLALHKVSESNYVIVAVNYNDYKDNPDYNFVFDIFVRHEVAPEPHFHGVGTFSAPSYPYTYSDPKGGNVVTLEKPEENEMAVSGETTLVDALNNWELVNYVDNNHYSGYPGVDWGRFGSALNGDYPVHCYYYKTNLTEGDEDCPTAKVVSTSDKTNGIPFRYYSHVGDALAYYNAQANGGIICIYGSDDMSGATVQSNDENVDVYVNGISYLSSPKSKVEPYANVTFFGTDALRNSSDWYVSLLQGDDSELNVTSGFVLDNTDQSGEVGGGTDDWHMVSSPLSGVPVGLSYADETQHAYGSDPVCSWNTALDGLFPTDAPLGSYDFYAYSEPDYHWINLKQNSASHYHQDGSNEPISYTNDTELVPGHGYLIALDKEILMQAKGQLNNGNVTVAVTRDGEHNKGLNFLGNPYLSSLDFDEFATNTDAGNASLWDGGKYAQSYMVLDADNKGYLTYAVGQSVNEDGLSRYIWPNQGFYIAADNAGTATFTNAMRVIKTDEASYFRGEGRVNYALVNLKATDSEGNRDMLTVELGRPEVGGARKVKDVRNGNGILYSHYQGGDYSVLFTEEGASQVPVWFESREDDTYTMTWSTYNGTFSYLHLIDNLTGADIDMLASSEYRYSSSISDYASRFKLVFSYTGVEEEMGEGEGQFVFQSGDELVVTGEGEVDIIDLNGRVLSHSRATGSQTAIAMPAVARGIYMVRLTSANGVKVNKIVVR